MKILLAVAVMFVSSVAIAWEHPNNPDRFPSLGLTYTGQAESGDYTIVGFSQDVDLRTGALILDTRLPLSNSFTLSVGLGSITTNIKSDATPILDADELDTSGGYFSIGARWYFNR